MGLFDDMLNIGMRSIGEAVNIAWELGKFGYTAYQNGKQGPTIPGLKTSDTEFVDYDMKPECHVIFGKPKSGKTRSESHQFAWEVADHWDGIFISLDASGSFTDDVLALLSTHPQWEQIKKRIVYIRLGDPDWVVPTPA